MLNLLVREQAAAYGVAGMHGGGVLHKNIKLYGFIKLLYFLTFAILYQENR